MALHRSIGATKNRVNDGDDLMPSKTDLMYGRSSFAEWIWAILLNTNGTVMREETNAVTCSAICPLFLFIMHPFQVSAGCSLCPGDS